MIYEIKPFRQYKNIPEMKCNSIFMDDREINYSSTFINTKQIFSIAKYTDAELASSDLPCDEEIYSFMDYGLVINGQRILIDKFSIKAKCDWYEPETYTDKGYENNFDNLEKYVDKIFNEIIEIMKTEQ